MSRTERKQNPRYKSNTIHHNQRHWVRDGKAITKCKCSWCDAARVTLWRRKADASNADW